ncbi:ABC transporter substrate-binding protein [Beijerinckia sp. L45]|uniref:ABC transporter substrate-binding protein n=1 Tax=Beijerinckia sp. L45 TaxID=1641855 RepID=UPI001AEE4625|nr:ABC transporter substrate-binding protein [Beijerinckia sp. L45]
MPKLSITVATGPYDRVRAIRDGHIEIEGCAVNYIELNPEELFFRAARHAEFDVCEMSFSTYILQVAKGISQYVAVPAFLSRAFRHSGFYIRTDRGIDRPEDLRGRTVGVPEYQMTAALWQRGLLRDQHGVDVDAIRWRTGGAEEPGRKERMRIELPSGIDVQAIPTDETLSGMLARGSLDAVIMPGVPSCFVQQLPHIGRLFPDYRRAEQDYYAKTKIHPIMHVVVVRKALLAQWPWLAASVYKAFRQAKAAAIVDLEYQTAFRTTLPWLSAELAATREVLGHDFWPYGVDENRHEIETMLRYSAQDGLIDTDLSVEDLFASSTLQSSRI